MEFPRINIRKYFFYISFYTDAILGKMQQTEFQRIFWSLSEFFFEASMNDAIELGTKRSSVEKKSK